MLSHVGIRYENTPEAWERAFLKMYHQAHYMLLNQKERQAVIGLVLCLDVLNVFIMDKDGVIGLSNPIEVHQVSPEFVILIHIRPSVRIQLILYMYWLECLYYLGQA